jgi:5'-deoxynucleotidase YfbR-like HD superfamily hydrolase
MTHDFRIRIRRLTPGEVRQDVDALLWAFKLLRIRRWIKQPYWKEENIAASYADRLEDFPRLETVAEHSWTVADSVLLLAPNFPYLNRPHAVELAILHDKMEIEIGDMNPLGRDGTGDKGHAFNEAKQADKHQRELDAIDSYCNRLRPDVARLHRSLLVESLECRTPEARLVKAVDKMQALAFILLKKGGAVEDKHLAFLIRFTNKNDRYFPPLRAHSQELLRRIFAAAAKEREVGQAELWRTASGIRDDDAGPRQLLLLPDDEWDDAEYVEESQPESTSKSVRLKEILAELADRPAAHTGIEAYRQLSDVVNRVEDRYWGSGHWSPPRHLPPGAITDRLYPIAPECMYPVPDYPGVDALVAKDQVVFVSRTGAIEIQEKDHADILGELTAFADRRARVVFEKADVDGDGVWAEKNRGWSEVRE